MLKPLLITTATLFSAVLVSLTTAQAANAATQSNSVQNGHQELIARGNKSSHISAQKQSDIKSIHQMLTRLYRSINEADVKSMFEEFMPSHANEKGSVKKLFSNLKSESIAMSVEVKEIRLLYLSGNDATIKVDLVRKLDRLGRIVDGAESATLQLTKYHGKWKISDAGFVVKSISKPH